MALRSCPTHLATLLPTMLLQTPVVALDGPRLFRVAQTIHFAQLKVATGPVLRVTVWGDDPKHLDQSITDQPNDRPRGRDCGVTNRQGWPVLQTDGAIGFQACQPT